MKITHTPDHTLVTLDGELDLAWAADHEAKVGRLLVTCAATVTLDFADVTFMDATGLNLVAELRQRCRGRGGAVYLSRLSPSAAKLLLLSGLLEDCRLGVAPLTGAPASADL